MNHVMIAIETPGAGTYDVRIPVWLPLHKIAALVSQAIMELSGGNFVPTGDTVLCDKETGTVLDINMNARELCLHNGVSLLLI